MTGKALVGILPWYLPSRANEDGAFFWFGGRLHGGTPWQLGLGGGVHNFPPDACLKSMLVLPA